MLDGDRPALPQSLRVRRRSRPGARSPVAGTRPVWCVKAGDVAELAEQDRGRARRPCRRRSPASTAMRATGKDERLRPRRQRLRPLLRRPDDQAEPVPGADRPGTVLRDHDGPGRSRHEGRPAHRPARASRALLGSVGQHCVHHATCPVVVVAAR